jgi:hypothetical protein
MLVGIRGDGCQATVTPLFYLAMSSNWLSYHPVKVENVGPNPIIVAISTKGKIMSGLQLKNFEALKELLYRLWFYTGMNENSFDSYWRDRGPVLMTREIAANLWFLQLPETEDTAILRHQIAYLNKQCHWDYAEGY